MRGPDERQAMLLEGNIGEAFFSAVFQLANTHAPRADRD